MTVKKKHKKRNNFIYPFLIVIIIALLSVIGAGFLYYRNEQQKNRIVGTWETSLDYTATIRESVKDWLGEEEEELVYPFVRIPVTLTLGEDETWNMQVDSASIHQLEAEGYAYFQACLESLVDKTLANAMADGDWNSAGVGKSTVARIEEVVEEDVQTYLQEMVPSLFPSTEAIQASFDGNGTYWYDRENKQIVFTTSQGTQYTESVVIQENVLVFTQFDIGNTLQYPERKYPMAFQRKE